MSRIQVLITDDRQSVQSVSSSSTSITSSTINNNGKLATNEVAKSDKSSKGLAVASMIANQTFNYMTSNIGKWTGSTSTQRKVDNAIQMVSIGAMAYVSPALAIANVGINLATTSMNTAYEERWDAKEKNNARLRAGELKGRGR